MSRHKTVTTQELIEGVSDYLNKTDIPVVAEYAHLNGITRQHLYFLAKESEELADAIKRIVEEKEIILEKGALSGKYNPTMAIFSLKQCGWKDRQEDETDRSVVVRFEAADEYGN